MKKALAILLSVLLLFSSVWTTALVGSAADPVDYDKAASWKVYASGDKLGDTPSITHTIEDNTNASHLHSTGSTSVKFVNMNGGMNAKSLAVPLEVEAGKTYALSFWYKAGMLTGVRYDFWYSGVYESGTTLSSGSNRPTGTAVATAANQISQTSDSTWYEYTLTFTVGTNTDLYFASQMWLASFMFIDDFQLKELIDYDKAASWKVYASGDKLGDTPSITHTIQDNTTTDHLHSTGSTSVKFVNENGGMHGKNIAVPLDVEAGKTYTLRFWYKAGIYASGRYDFWHSGIYEKGATFASGSTKPTG